MASYVKYETPKEIVSKSLEALTIANDTGRVRKGANEATKGIESGTAQLVLIASDVEPQEVVMHLPEICREKSIAFVYIPTKKEIGAACGIPVPCAAVSIDKAGNAAELVKAIVAKVAPMCGVEAKKEEPKAEKKPEKKEEPKAEAKHEKKEHKEKKKKEAPKEKAEEQAA
jgi:large subunit ribosomal protein L7Ae